MIRFDNVPAQQHDVHRGESWQGDIAEMRATHDDFARATRFIDFGGAVASVLMSNMAPNDEPIVRTTVVQLLFEHPPVPYDERKFILLGADTRLASPQQALAARAARMTGVQV